VHGGFVGKKDGGARSERVVDREDGMVSRHNWAVDIGVVGGRHDGFKMVLGAAAYGHRSVGGEKKGTVRQRIVGI
jgi:hypothetical protein